MIDEYDYIHNATDKGLAEMMMYTLKVSGIVSGKLYELIIEAAKRLSRKYKKFEYTFEIEVIKHKILRIGHTFKWDGYKYHVVEIVRESDGKGGVNLLYVVKYYGKHKQWWHYEVWNCWEYDMRIRKLI